MVTHPINVLVSGRKADRKLTADSKELEQWGCLEPVPLRLKETNVSMWRLFNCIWTLKEDGFAVTY